MESGFGSANGSMQLNPFVARTSREVITTMRAPRRRAQPATRGAFRRRRGRLLQSPRVAAIGSSLACVLDASPHTSSRRRRRHRKSAIADLHRRCGRRCHCSSILRSTYRHSAQNPVSLRTDGRWVRQTLERCRALAWASIQYRQLASRYGLMCFRFGTSYALTSIPSFSKKILFRSFASSISLEYETTCTNRLSLVW